MPLIEVVFIGIGLAMDAFAVAICQGLSFHEKKHQKALYLAFSFGLFQAFMPLIGYYLGLHFSSFLQLYSHWVAFGLLGWIGSNMMRESFHPHQTEGKETFSFFMIFFLSIATSIDALAVGITFSFFPAHILWNISLIGGITFLLSLLGAQLGQFWGHYVNTKASFLGGMILLLIGIKMLFS